MSSPTEQVEKESVASRPRRAKYLVLLGFCVYCGVVWYLGWQEVRDKLLNARWELIAFSALLIFVATWARVWKWRYALGEAHHSAGLFFVSKATGNWTPGRLGEFAPMAIRTHRTPKIGAWIMFDRLLEIIVTLALGLYGLAMIELLTPGQYGVVLALTIVASALGVYLITRRSFFLWLAEKSRPESFAYKTAMLFAAVSEELYLFARKLPLAGAITIVTKCVDLYAVGLMFVALGYRPGFALMSAAKCALAIVSFIPITPAATGLPHGTQAWLMNRVADIPYEGLVAGIGVEVLVVSVTFWTSFGLASSSIKKMALQK